MADAELVPVKTEFSMVKTICGIFVFLSFRLFIRSRVSREVCFLDLRLFSVEVVIVGRSSSLQFFGDEVTTVAGGSVFTLFSDLLSMDMEFISSLIHLFLLGWPKGQSSD